MKEFCVDTPNEDNLSVYPGLIAEGMSRNKYSSLICKQKGEMMMLKQFDWFLGKTLFEAEKYHLSVDMHIVSSTKSFVEAMGMVFMTYYVLNLDYHPKTPATLEYLQR